MGAIDDDVAALRARVDQARETSKEIAGLLGTYRKALISEGFPESEAYSLCSQLQADP